MTFIPDSGAPTGTPNSGAPVDSRSEALAIFNSDTTNIEAQEAADAAESVANAAAAEAAAAKVSGEPSAPTNTAVKGVKALGSYFGLDEAALADEGKAAETMRPYIDALIEAGSRQQYNPAPAAPHVNNAPAVPQAPTVDENAPVEIDFDSDEFADTPPSVIKAMKQMHQQQVKSYKAAVARAEAAEKANKDQRAAYEKQQLDNYQAQQREVSQRAYAHVDRLNSPRYGSGQNRTLIQRMAVQKIMDTADNIIRGVQAYGGQSPTIEAIIDAAILRVEGSNQPAPQQQQQQILPISAHQRPAFGTAAPAQKIRNGSAGQGGQLMDNAAYMEGARAILSR